MNTQFASNPVRVPAKYRAEPFAYHQEVELDIVSLTNLGEGVGRTAGGWVVFVAGALPGERVRVRIWHNAKNFSRGDLVSVLVPAKDRVEPRCQLFGKCGGCQYQNLRYEAQLGWKTRQVAELLERIGKISFPVSPCEGSPKRYGYRSKITPHFERPRGNSAGGAEEAFPIGFLAAGTARRLVDVPACPIATDKINATLPQVRARVRSRAARGEFKRGATLLLRETLEGVATDPKAQVSERVGESGLVLRFVAGDFFQNNPFILPKFVDFVVRAARGNAGGCRYLVDAYCGSGLFALSAAKFFERVVGVEVGEDTAKISREKARSNASRIVECLAGPSETVFAIVAFPPEKTAVVLDPPRRGSDPVFIAQLLAFSPRRIVYVSCGPDTQARDLQAILEGGNYRLEAIQPFDLFPQTRHIENIAVLARK